MSRGVSPAYARDRLPVEALELQIEAAWERLTRMGPCGKLTVCLSQDSGRLNIRPAKGDPQAQPYPGEVGTYTRNVELAHLRDDVFHEFGARPGRPR